MISYILYKAEQNHILLFANVHYLYGENYRQKFESVFLSKMYACSIEFCRQLTFEKKKNRSESTRWIEVFELMRLTGDRR